MDHSLTLPRVVYEESHRQDWTNTSKKIDSWALVDSGPERIWSVNIKEKKVDRRNCCNKGGIMTGKR